MSLLDVTWCDTLLTIYRIRTRLDKTGQFWMLDTNHTQTRQDPTFQLQNDAAQLHRATAETAGRDLIQTTTVTWQTPSSLTVLFEKNNSLASFEKNNSSILAKVIFVPRFRTKEKFLPIMTAWLNESITITSWRTSRWHFPRDRDPEMNENNNIISL